MRQIVTQGIVLSRVDFQEADRILTVLTPDEGKVSLLAKGVRRPKSKLAGGIELLSVSDITYLPGRGEVSSLVSSRLIKHYGHIVSDINRTLLAYDLLKRVNRATEQAAEASFFELLRAAFQGLDSLDLSPQLTELWFDLQLLKITGHTPNLQTDTAGQALQADQTYLFDMEAMTFVLRQGGPCEANYIKFLRLGLAAAEPAILGQVTGAENLIDAGLTQAKAMLQQSIRV